MQITSLTEFVERAKHETNENIYDMFEFDTADAVRDEIYELADTDSAEPFRNAMAKLGIDY